MRPEGVVERARPLQQPQTQDFGSCIYARSQSQNKPFVNQKHVGKGTGQEREHHTHTPAFPGLTY